MVENLNLRHLSFFVRTAEAGSITRAAEELHVSQPAVSQAITELERQLGVQLMIRRRARGVSPTAAGHHLLGDARRLLAGAGDFVASAAELGSEVRGVLSVGCASTIAPFLMPRLMSGFRAEFPAVEFDYGEGLSEDLQNQLRAGRREIVVLYDTNVGADLEQIELARVRPYILLSERHPLAGSEAIPLDALGEYDMVMLDFPESETYARALVASAGITPRVAHRSGNFETVRALVAHGEGFAILHQRPAADVSYDGVPLVAHPIVGSVAEVRVVVVTTSAADLTQRARAFVDYSRRDAILQQGIHK